MSRRVASTLAVCGAVALSLGGCAGPGRQLLSGASQAPPSAATDPCTGVAGCVEAATVDVDGDGNLDRVGVVVVAEQPPPQVAFGRATVTAMISTVDGVKRLDMQSPGVIRGIDTGNPQPFVGAFRISRKGSADLVFHTKQGSGSSEEFQVIGWAGGEPKLVPRPKPERAPLDEPDNVVWYVGSSHGVHEWVTCGDTWNKLLAPTSEGIPIPGGGIRQSDHFDYDGNQWNPMGSENSADADFSYDFDPDKDTFQCEDLAAHHR